MYADKVHHLPVSVYFNSLHEKNMQGLRVVWKANSVAVKKEMGEEKKENK